MCEQFEMYQKVEIMAQYLRRRSHTEDEPGKCKFCGIDLPLSYVVFNVIKGERYECKPGSKEAEKAKRIVDEGSGASEDGPFPDIMVFPQTMCEAMGDKAIYYRAQALNKDYYEKKKEQAQPKKPEVFVKAAGW